MQVGTIDVKQREHQAKSMIAEPSDGNNLKEQLRKQLFISILVAQALHTGIPNLQ
jgi:hypothetical protein